MHKPRIAITMGDPAGIGPELCLRVLADTECREKCHPVVVGDSAILEQVRACCSELPNPAYHVLSLADLSRLSSLEGPVVIHVPELSEKVSASRVSAATGAAGYRYFVTAIDMAVRGVVDGITTGPIHKEALRAAGILHPGHTEILAERTNFDRYCMMLTSEEITCSFVTTHVGYADVPALLTKERILEVVELTASAMRRMRSGEPRLVICGLNPHAGEHGLFGRGEEESIIAPAAELARLQGITIEGPLPPDTAFLPQRRRATDAFICMYHDQGHIPLKALAFDEAVNVTLGLPIVRTSVDHGTALDIAWQGIAKPTSFLHAIELAARLALDKQ